MLERVGPYKILDRLGSGGIGDLYRALDTRLGRTVAVRAVRAAISGDPSRREQFLVDAGAASSISHPNIATLYETVDQDGTLFVVSEFAPGDSLAALIAGRPLNPRRAVDLAIQLSDALAEAHAGGIVHGDLRPDSIVVTPKGNGKILDFGLSAWTRGGAVRRAAPGLGGARVSDLDMGSISRTLPYLSPEQALGEQVDCQSDIFSIGSILFEMLTGVQPFSGSTRGELMRGILHTEPSSPSSLNPLLPPELDPILRKALSKRSDDRYSAAATLAAELRAVAAVLEARAASAGPVSSGEYRRRRPGPRRALWLTLGGLAVASAAWLLARLLAASY
jgi:eukaryotic-like serine/threonine-protein kinase